ncbi:MAG: gliding motility protein GldN [Bacteroidales bacterium]|nr:gliding motility protein GldN [Bacteroidales bacterium]
MKKGLFVILAIAATVISVNAQNIIDAEDGHNPNDFYQQGLVVGKKAMPYPYLRESDVVWKTTIWRAIDMNETFNQYMYFPQDNERNTQGRINLVNLIVTTAANGDFDVYEDDDMKIPQEWDKARANLAGQQVIRVDTGEEDEDGNPIYVDSTAPGEPDFESFKKVMLKEYWYIDKQDTRQKVRIVGLCFIFDKMTYQAGTEVPLSGQKSFWVPMNEMNVRQVLVNANAYEASNDVAERSYDDIFIQRYFDSYITRESNVYNRSIDDYLTGEDAILRSQAIENQIFDIESDMWEY